MEWVKNNYSVILDDPIARSIIIAFSSVLIAKLSDVIFVSIIKKMSTKTKSDLDDKIVDLLHKPIFYSILFVGFSTAVKTAGLPDYLDFAIVGIFKTITILILSLIHI